MARKNELAPWEVVTCDRCEVQLPKPTSGAPLPIAWAFVELRVCHLTRPEGSDEEAPLVPALVSQPPRLLCPDCLQRVRDAMRPIRPPTYDDE